jgi:hypothetical protein
MASEDGPVARLLRTHNDMNTEQSRRTQWCRDASGRQDRVMTVVALTDVVRNYYCWHSCLGLNSLTLCQSRKSVFFPLKRSLMLPRELFRPGRSHHSHPLPPQLCPWTYKRAPSSIWPGDSCVQAVQLNNALNHSTIVIVDVHSSRNMIQLWSQGGSDPRNIEQAKQVNYYFIIQSINTTILIIKWQLSVL